MSGSADLDAFLARGWVRFARDPAIAAWAEAARAPALALTRAPDAEFRCDGTWFPGVNTLPNDAAGAIAGQVPPLAGAPLDFAEQQLGLGAHALDAAQISICYSGYPRHGAEETEAAYRYRLNRDAAHVDGLLREKPSRRRRLGEAHGYILGLPLVETAAAASPLVVWEGSHEIMRAAFRQTLGDLPPGRWGERDVTEIYQETRRRVFETCRRVAIPAQPGESYVVHRLALHGVAPWRAAADAAPRSIAYFRPNPWPDADFGWWLDRP